MIIQTWLWVLNFYEKYTHLFHKKYDILKEVAGWLFKNISFSTVFNIFSLNVESVQQYEEFSEMSSAFMKK